MLLLIIIKAKACLGWSLRMMFPSFWCWQLFFIYDFQDRDGPSYCKVSFKSFKNVSNAYLLFLYKAMLFVQFMDSVMKLWKLLVLKWYWQWSWPLLPGMYMMDVEKSRFVSLPFFYDPKKWLKIQSRNWTNGKPQKGSQNIHLYLNSLDIRQSYCFLFRVLSLKHY